MPARTAPGTHTVPAKTYTLTDSVGAWWSSEPGVWLWAADSPRGHANGQVDSEQDAKDHARRAAVYLAQPQAFRWMSQILAVRSDDVHLISLYRQSLASSFNAGSSDVYRDEMVRRGFAVQPART